MTPLHSSRRVSCIPAATSLVLLLMFQFHVEECLLCPRAISCFCWSRVEGRHVQWNISCVPGDPGSQFEIYNEKWLTSDPPAKVHDNLSATLGGDIAVDDTCAQIHTLYKKLVLPSVNSSCHGSIFFFFHVVLFVDYVILRRGRSCLTKCMCPQKALSRPPGDIYTSTEKILVRYGSLLRSINLKFDSTTHRIAPYSCCIVFGCM